VQVTRAYESNRPLMEVLTRNSERKSRYVGQITDKVSRYRRDLSREADVPPLSVAESFRVVRHCNGLDGQLFCELGGR